MEESEKIVGMLTEEQIESIHLNRYSPEELAAIRNEKRRELAKLEREQREGEKQLRLLQSVHKRLNDDREIHEMSLNEITNLRTDLVEARRISSKEDTRDLDTLIAICDGIIKINGIANQAIVKTERFVRITKNQILREHECSKPVENLCIVCQKRPRHFGDYCKRCVPSELRPTGKV